MVVSEQRFDTVGRDGIVDLDSRKAEAGCSFGKCDHVVAFPTVSPEAALRPHSAERIGGRLVACGCPFGAAHGIECNKVKRQRKNLTPNPGASPAAAPEERPPAPDAFSPAPGDGRVRFQR